jgi:DNA-binding Xre family transcriptional regulator
MKITYKRLWKLLIDKDMKKSDLRKKLGFSSSTMAKLANDENVHTSTLVKICELLKCKIADICEIVKIDEIAK